MICIFLTIQLEKHAAATKKLQLLPGRDVVKCDHPGKNFFDTPVSRIMSV
jgi:hypothetical protein